MEKLKWREKRWIDFLHLYNTRRLFLNLISRCTDSALYNHFLCKMT